jgi:uracil phosphoribosyltransferase
MAVTLVSHPLLSHKVGLLRRAETPTALFRQLLREIALLLTYEVTRDLELEAVEIATPLERTRGWRLGGKKLCFVSILRAGHGLLDGMLDLVPSARVGHIGLYRDHETLKPVEYYAKLPDDIAERLTIVVDPMLATGHSAVAAVERIRSHGGRRIKMLCVIAAPEGLATFEAAWPDVSVYTAAVDRQLDERGYIRPGLGDAGDRLYGTR